MKFLLISIGSRGDMEPLMAMGEKLQKEGHEIVCVFPEQFRSLAVSSGFGFASLGTEFIDMLSSKEGQLAMGGAGNFFSKLNAYIKLGVKYRSLNRLLVKKQYEIVQHEKPDKIIHNGKAIYPVIWAEDHPGKTILNSPVPYLLHYVKGHSHLSFNGNYGAFWNKLTYKLAWFGLMKTVVNASKMLPLSKKYTGKQIKRALMRNKTVYTISPSLFPRPGEWEEHVQVLGYHERDKTHDWKPSASLNSFLNKHQKVLLITFGSMGNPKPVEKTSIILDILQRNQIPTLINTASGGLVKPDNYDASLIHFVDQIPYDWVLPKIHAAIHHGGSGTTHSVLKYGCASMIVPHIIDQFVWNKIQHRLGVGPKGMRIDKIKKKTLEPKLLDLFNNASYKRNAEEVAAKMKNEHFDESLIQFLTQDN